MKVREGFVSNSSTTSFTVLFKETAQDDPWFEPIRFIANYLQEKKAKTLKKLL